MEADRRSSLERAIQTGVIAELKDLHTCLPGEVISFNAAEQTADIQPMIKRKFKGEWVNIPVLKSVPVRYQRSADFAITFPLAKGDQVMLVFCERSIDTWLEQGGIKAPADFRRHDYSDAFALPMMYPKTNKIPAMDAANLQIKTISGNIKFTIRPDGSMDVTAAGDVDITTDTDVNINTTGNSYIKSALTTIDNNLLVTGSITGQQGLAITGIHPVAGVGGKITGDMDIQDGNMTVTNGAVSADGIDLETHVHGGVQTGTGTTGVPQ